MNRQHASRTAEFMALFRALESNLPVERRLFTDHFAQSFLRPTLRFLTQIARFRPLGLLTARIIDWRWPGARTSGIARTRFIDDACLKALHEDFKQVVILGAGFDARAYRFAEMEKVRVFEVDHPDTSVEKQRYIRLHPNVKTSHVLFVAADLRKQELGEVMDHAGFDHSCRTFFIWEGVTNYLSAEGVNATFCFVRTCAPGSRILFTYVHRAVLEHPASFSGTRHLTRTLRQVGESWTFGFDPAELSDYLQQRGLHLLADVGSVEYRARYLGKEGHHLQGYAFYRVAEAEVALQKRNGE